MKALSLTKRTLIGLIVFVASGIHVLAQSIEYRGKVLDDSGESLVGVLISLEGTTKGTTTDLDGRYTIEAEPDQVLVFSMVGMDTKKVTLGGNKTLDVEMQEATELLQEFVVNGFQQVNRKLFTGAADNLKMSDISIKGIVDVSRSLEGRVAGVSVDNVSGTFGSSPRIRIRGSASINGNNQPLFVVDGVILEDLSNVNTDDLISGNANTLISSSVANLNPDDIESFQILKDASATAIYGARAANGVVVITTKRGKSGKLSVNYSGNFSGKLRPTYGQFNLLNSAQEMEVYRELVEKGIIDISTAVKAQNYGSVGKMYALIAANELPWGPGGSLNENFLNKYENANTDWFNTLFRNFGLQQQHSVSFTSGNEKSNSYYSLSYLNDEGQTIADKVERITGSARNSYAISDNFSFGLKLTASYRNQKAPGTRDRELDPLTGRISRNFDINPFSYALNTSRSIRPIDDSGNREFFRRNYAPFNILHELENNFINIRVADISAQTDFELKLAKNLNVRGVFQMRYATTEREHVVTENSNQAEAFRADDTQFIQQSNNFLFNDPDNPGLNPQVVLPQGGFNYLDISDLQNYYSRISADWSKELGRDHEISVLTGAELRATNRNETSSTGIGVIYESGGIVVTDPKIIQFFNLQNIDFFSLSQEKDRFVGTFLNAGYAYKGKYIANFTVRYDGSNQLGESVQARYLPTWNISGAWNIHEENWMSQFPKIDNLKLRSTYGISGNLPPDASAFLNLQSDVTIRPSDVEPSLFIEDLTNTELTWEKLQEFNLGLDFAFFDSKVSGTANYYTRQSFDLIGTVQTSGIGGQGLKVGNFADMTSTGYEFAITTQNHKSTNVSWTTSFNIGYSRERITKLDFGPRITDAIGQGGAALKGGPRRGLYSAKFAGLNEQGIPTFFGSEGEIVSQFDLQNRNGLTQLLAFEGTTEPRGAGGLSNTLRYKNLTFSFLLSFKIDYKIRLNDSFSGSYSDFDALPGELADRWVVPGDEQLTNVPVILDRNAQSLNTNATLAYELYNKSTVRVADGDYLRLKSVRLSYMLPQNFIKRLKLSRMNVSFEGQNLALLFADDRLKGQDPEFFSTGGVSLPQPRLLTFSLNVGF